MYRYLYSVGMVFTLALVLGCSNNSEESPPPPTLEESTPVNAAGPCTFKDKAANFSAIENKLRDAGIKFEKSYGETRYTSSGIYRDYEIRIIWTLSPELLDLKVYDQIKTLEDFSLAIEEASKCYKGDYGSSDYNDANEWETKRRLAEQAAAKIAEKVGKPAADKIISDLEELGLKSVEGLSGPKGEAIFDLTHAKRKDNAEDARTRASRAHWYLGRSHLAIELASMKKFHDGYAVPLQAALRNLSKRAGEAGDTLSFPYTLIAAYNRDMLGGRIEAGMADLESKGIRIIKSEGKHSLDSQYLKDFLAAGIRKDPSFSLSRTEIQSQLRALITTIPPLLNLLDDATKKAELENLGVTLAAILRATN